jgi:hypothetical protein
MMLGLVCFGITEERDGPTHVAAVTPHNPEPRLTQR